MTRKRLKKLLMSKGVKRNLADWISKAHAENHKDYWQSIEPLFSEDYWKAVETA